MQAADEANDPHGPTGRLANWVELAVDDVPSTEFDRAETVLAREGSGDTVAIGSGRTTNAPAAAVRYGTFIQAFELDDQHPVAPLHSCSPLIPALLSTASNSLPPTRGVDFLDAARLPDAGPRLAPNGFYAAPITERLRTDVYDVDNLIDLLSAPVAGALD